MKSERFVQVPVLLDSVGNYKNRNNYPTEYFKMIGVKTITFQQDEVRLRFFNFY